MLAFIVQLVILAQEQVNPSHKETVLEQTQLDAIALPVLFKMCFKNSFNLEKLEAAGYSSVWNYNAGVSKYNRSLFGWAGHTKYGGVGMGVSGIFNVFNIK